MRIGLKGKFDTKYLILSRHSFIEVDIGKILKRFKTYYGFT